MKYKTNYDKIADTYNQRYIENPYPSMLKALRGILSLGNPHKVIEVGCGTSHWLEALRTIKGVTLFGIDSSFKMLDQSQHPDEIYLTQAKAARLPFLCNAFDLVFTINAFHHFADKFAFIKEARRILITNGKLSIIDMDPRDNRNKWYVYKFFKGTYDCDLERFPAWSQVKSWLSQAGFKNLVIQDIEMIHDPKYGRDVLLDPFLKKNACSQLAMLSEKEYQHGLDKITDVFEGKYGTDYKFENDIILTMISGEK
ncbi:MAG: methyltransferase domain-containing protein [Chloroflexota bacterium]|nr:methyltransferase domain-containing protein [Chloroflexota bacterium]